MKTRTKTTLGKQPWLAGIAAIAMTASLVSTAARADEAKAEPKPSPEEQAMMEKYMKAATPGEHHAHLAKLAGDWKVDVSFWMAADAPASHSTGTVKLTPMMDNRYLHEEVRGTADGQPFHGAGLSGYDNVTGKHWNTWVDNMGTGPMTSWGTCEGGDKVINSKGEVPDALSGKMTPFRSVWRMVSDNKTVYEMYQKGKDGKEYKSLEVVYTR